MVTTSAQPFAAARQRDDRHAKSRRLGDYPAPWCTKDDDAMTATDETGGFGQRANFLAAPAERRFGMGDCERLRGSKR